MAPLCANHKDSPAVKCLSNAAWAFCLMSSATWAMQGKEQHVQRRWMGAALGGVWSTIHKALIIDR